MSRAIVRSQTWHSSPRSSNGSLLRSWRATFQTNKLLPSGPPISLQTGAFHGDGSSQDFLWHPGCSWLGSGDAARNTRPECSLRHCRPRHPPDKATKVVRCRWNSTCMDFIIHPRSTAISHFQRPPIRTDSAEIRRATGISLGTAPLHPVYLGCHLHRRFTWCWSSLLCRRQPTLPPLPSRRPTVCRSEIGWVHRKSRGLDEVESAEAELRQDSTHVAWIQTAVGEDRHKELWRSVNTPSNLRPPPRISVWHSTVNWEWTCMSTTSLAAVFISWDSWDPSDDHFPRMPRKHWSIPSYQVVSITVTVSFTVPQTLSWEDCNLSSTPQPGLISNRRKFDHITPVLRDQLHWLPIRQRIDFKIAVSVYNALHGRGPTCLSRTCNPVREVGARAHLRSAIRGDLTVPRTRDSSLWAQKLPCLGTGRLELTAREPSNSGNCRWNVSNLCWKHIYFAMHMPSSAHSAFVTWLRSA